MFIYHRIVHFYYFLIVFCYCVYCHPGFLRCPCTINFSCSLFSVNKNLPSFYFFKHVFLKNPCFFNGYRAEMRQKNGAVKTDLKPHYFCTKCGQTISPAPVFVYKCVSLQSCRIQRSIEIAIFETVYFQYFRLETGRGHHPDHFEPKINKIGQLQQKLHLTKVLV